MRSPVSLNGPVEILAWLSLGLASPLFSSADAFAFAISDHLKITKVALAELKACGELDPALTGISPEMKILMGNIGEDLNLVRKWSVYSHYYNPYKTLDMRREDSAVTVLESESELRALLANSGDLSEIALLLGRAIHHIQDSSVPAHVVPIDHTSFTDGFESLEVPEERYSNLTDSRNCDRLTQVRVSGGFPGTLMQILRANAIATLDSMDAKINFWDMENFGQASWNVAFWASGPGAEFGSYGSFGNIFGKAEGPIYVDAGTYQEYKAARMRAAVEATETAVLWLQRRL